MRPCPTSTVAPRTPVRLLLGGLLAMLVVGACSIGGGGGGTPTPSPPIRADSVPGVGDVLVDDTGHTLYFDQRDTDPWLSCFNSVTYSPAWPPLPVYQPLDGQWTTLRAVPRCDHRTQRVLLLNGQPVYTYRPGGTPEPVGTITADGLDGHYVARRYYTIRLTRQVVFDRTTQRSAAVTHLADSDGLPLYTFSLDTATIPAPLPCPGPCADSWGAVPAPAQWVVAAPLQTSDFAVLNRPTSDGVWPQLTYRGRPLYRSRSAYSPGNTQGHTLREFGGEWRLAEL